MGPINRMNPEKVHFFPLIDYINRIKLSPFLLEHLEETNHQFDNYFKQLSKYSDYSVVYYWIDSLAKEMIASQAIESHTTDISTILRENAFFDTLSMSHTRIKRLHQLVMKEEKTDDYRQSNVRVSRMIHRGGRKKNKFFGMELNMKM